MSLCSNLQHSLVLRNIIDDFVLCWSVLHIARSGGPGARASFACGENGYLVFGGLERAGEVER